MGIWKRMAYCKSVRL